MKNNIKNPLSVSIIGGSGYTGAELIRLLSKHPYFMLFQVVANRNVGKKIQTVFPHLRHLDLPDFISFEEMNFEKVDIIFLIVRDYLHYRKYNRTLADLKIDHQ